MITSKKTTTDSEKEFTDKDLTRNIADIHKSGRSVFFALSIGSKRKIRLSTPLRHQKIVPDYKFAVKIFLDYKLAEEFDQQLLQLQKDFFELKPSSYVAIQNITQLSNPSHSKIKWERYFKSVLRNIPNSKDYTVEVDSLTYFEKLGELLSRTPNSVLKIYLRFASMHTLLRRIESVSCEQLTQDLFPHVFQDQVWRYMGVRDANLQPKELFDNLTKIFSLRNYIGQDNKFNELIGRYKAAQDFLEGKKLSKLYSSFYPKRHFARTLNSALKAQWRRFMMAAFKENKLIFTEDGYHFKENLPFPTPLYVEEGLDHDAIVDNFAFAFAVEIFNEFNRVRVPSYNSIIKNIQLHQLAIAKFRKCFVSGKNETRNNIEISFLLYREFMDEYRNSERHMPPAESADYMENICFMRTDERMMRSM